jgi:hypothetical protein
VAKALATLARPTITRPKQPPPQEGEEGDSTVRARLELEEDDFGHPKCPNLGSSQSPSPSLAVNLRDDFVHESRDPVRRARLRACVEMLSAWADAAKTKG